MTLINRETTLDRNLELQIGLSVLQTGRLRSVKRAMNYSKRNQKVDLRAALRLLRILQPICYSTWVEAICAHFDCSERTAKDVIAVLRKAGYVDTLNRLQMRLLGKECPPRGRIFYLLTDLGATILSIPYGRVHDPVRLARRLYTSLPSDRIRTYQRGIENAQGRENLLRRVEITYNPIPSTVTVGEDSAYTKEDALHEALLHYEAIFYQALRAY